MGFQLPPLRGITVGVAASAWSCPIAACPAPSLVARGLSRPSSIVVDDTHAYIADTGHDAVVRVPK